MARNPKDVCVSLLGHIRRKRPDTFAGDMSDLIRTFVEGRCESEGVENILSVCAWARETERGGERKTDG